MDEVSKSAEVTGLGPDDTFEDPTPEDHTEDPTPATPEEKADTDARMKAEHRARAKAEFRAKVKADKSEAKAIKSEVKGENKSQVRFQINHHQQRAESKTGWKTQNKHESKVKFRPEVNSRSRVKKAEDKPEDMPEIDVDLPCLYLMEKNRSFGRHLVASQDIPAGSLIIKENPLFVEPLDPNEDFDPLNSYFRGPIAFSCLSCHQEIRDCYRCPSCRLPVCSIKCSEAPNHHNFECKIFSGDTLYNPQPVLPMVLYPAISILRLLIIKKENPDLWSKIVNLQSKPAIPKLRSSLYDKYSHDMDFHNFKSCFHFRKKKVEMVEKIGINDWETLKDILDINGFIMDNIKKTRVRNLYPISSFLTNGCFPNCTWSIGPGPKFAMEIWSAVEIPEGEPLTIMYPRNETLVGAIERQKLSLKKSNQSLRFFCFCPRCVDPTESGTIFSGVRCVECEAPDGFFLSSNPYKLDANWVCQNDECQNETTCEEIEKLINKHQNIINSIIYHDLQPGYIEYLIEEFLENLGPNHWLFLSLSRHVMLRIEKKKNPDDDYITDLYISMARDVDKIYDMIMPGLNLHKYDIKMKLHKALLAKYQKEVGKEQEDEDFYKLTHQLVEIFEIQSEIWQLHRRDPNRRNNAKQFKVGLEKLKAEIIFRIDVQKIAKPEDIELMAKLMKIKTEFDPRKKSKKSSKPKNKEFVDDLEKLKPETDFCEEAQKLARPEEIELMEDLEKLKPDSIKEVKDLAEDEDEEFEDSLENLKPDIDSKEEVQKSAKPEEIELMDDLEKLKPDSIKEVKDLAEDEDEEFEDDLEKLEPDIDYNEEVHEFAKPQDVEFELEN